jgi:hypothetical protein
MNGSEYVHEIDNVLEDQSTLTLIHHDHQWESINSNIARNENQK